MGLGSVFGDFCDLVLVWVVIFVDFGDLVLIWVVFLLIAMIWG